MLDYAALAALAAVVREGGFERAAAVLGVTPSAVSQRVRALEERLGAVLVVRGQPPVPMETGARLCARAERVRLLEGELARALPAAAGSQGGCASTCAWLKPVTSWSPSRRSWSSIRMTSRPIAAAAAVSTPRRKAIVFFPPRHWPKTADTGLPFPPKD